ncbi:prephenate dehydratase [Jeotgalicoccus meleagridis]|uniref:Prephenate dehydratase n=1 Tax=Jeotgalicoccus meleagridis TaxID=2759181 RepID=A0A6V7RDL3_9STAP|nr:prephenate dehydratase domain-containing protein [Jeotgalicoccus meleagridis]CAD2075560.1 P-protein [Jeotgalicoccus meleagridis]
MKIGYQGVEGSYSTLACQKFAKEKTYSTKGYMTFKLLVEALLDNEVDYIALPVENSTSGPITRTIDLMKYLDVKAVEEIYIKIDHSLISKEPIELNDLTEVYSHPEALEQCYTYLSQYPHIEVKEFSDTAGAVHMVKESDDKTIASIAGSHAAQMYDMNIIRENISDNPLNTTRFLIFTKKSAEKTLREKTSLYVESTHSSGSLSHILDIFTAYNINLVYLMSRPIQNKPFSYGFFIDIENGLDRSNFEAALKALEDKTSYINILGSYDKGLIPEYEGVIQNETNSNK